MNCLTHGTEVIERRADGDGLLAAHLWLLSVVRRDRDSAGRGWFASNSAADWVCDLDANHPVLVSIVFVSAAVLMQALFWGINIL